MESSFQGHQRISTFAHKHKNYLADLIQVIEGRLMQNDLLLLI